MKVAIVTFPGSNCDYDLYKCIQLVGGSPQFVWHREVELGDVDAVMLPGGFSYGDYLRAGAIATMRPVMDAVKAFAASGGPVLGICNGFQMLCEAGLLPGALLRNSSLLFASQDILLRVESDATIFTRDYPIGQILRMPIAHAEGNYHADEETLDRLEGEGRVLFRYVDASGETTTDANPNGSAPQHRRHPQRREQRHGDDAPSRKSRGGDPGLRGRARPLRGAPGAPLAGRHVHR